MKKTILLSFALFMAAAVFAQTKPATKTGTKAAPVTKTSATATSATAPAPSQADCYINKTWKLTKVEKFGITKDPGDDMKGDMLSLSNDGTFKMVIKGVEKTGTWSRGSWMSLKPSDGSEMLPVKIESCEGSTLKVDWRDGDTHNHFTYSL
jgi:hypothetical protein